MVLLGLVFLQDKPLTQGLVISESCGVRPGTYRLDAPGETLSAGTIVIRGSGITVDFRGAELAGSDASADPDKRQGLGLLVEGDGITIKNLRVRGYKIGLLAKNCAGLKLTDCDFSYNWKQRLLSTPEREDVADWMSYHHNEEGEWMRYGAGAYLQDCTKFEVKNLRVTGGQCGLMLTRCNKGLVWNCDLSFNSALGLGMYRSSENKVMHNKMDWCVRGFSHGVYNRGQDSAGILVFEQCMRNLFAYNSATHGGDGFFLWAGQETMDSGKGGCNDNVLYGNDFSNSPCNAIEATFSRNEFRNNLLIDSWHGVWGGYSYDTVIADNTFGLNGESIAIEHGQNNKIVRNAFAKDNVSLYLWQSDLPPDPAWGYPKHRDVRNFGTLIAGNSVSQCGGTAVVLGSGSDLTFSGNSMTAALPFQFQGTQSNVAISDSAITGPKPAAMPSGVTTSNTAWSDVAITASKPWKGRGGNALVDNEPTGSDYLASFKTLWNPNDRTTQGFVPKLAGGQDAFLPAGTLRGQRTIIVDEWGPYDFRRPILVQRKSSVQGDRIEAVFDVLGPKGKCALDQKSEGLTVDKESFELPATLRVSWPRGSKDVEVSFTYTGAATVSVKGERSKAGEKVAFGWSKSYTPIDWTVSYWPWDESNDPRKVEEKFHALLATAPLARDKPNELSFATSGSPFEGVPADHFATLAEGQFETTDGEYELRVTTDDGVRIWLDGEKVLDEWHWQGPTPYSVTKVLKSGQHKLRVEHFEIDGYTALKVDIKKTAAR